MATTKTVARKRRPATKTKTTPAVKTKTTGRARTGARSTSSTTKGKASTTKSSTSKVKKSPVKSEEKKSGPARDFDPHGFVVGSDSSMIAEGLIEGGFDRREVSATIADTISKTSGLATRNGGEKNVSSLVSGIMSRLEEKGYTVESTWRLVPPADVQAEMKKAATAAKRKASRSKA